MMMKNCHSATWQGYHHPSAKPCPPLPHTGYDLTLLFAVAIVILLMGIGLRLVVGKKR
jgi:LPXTG-motif cell wall-anchored protein